MKKFTTLILSVLIFFTLFSANTEKVNADTPEFTVNSWAEDGSTTSIEYVINNYPEAIIRIEEGVQLFANKQLDINGKYTIIGNGLSIGVGLPHNIQDYTLTYDYSFFRVKNGGELTLDGVHLEGIGGIPNCEERYNSLSKYVLYAPDTYDGGTYDNYNSDIDEVVAAITAMGLTPATIDNGEDVFPVSYSSGIYRLRVEDINYESNTRDFFINDETGGFLLAYNSVDEDDLDFYKVNYVSFEYEEITRVVSDIPKITPVFNGSYRNGSFSEEHLAYGPKNTVGNRRFNYDTGAFFIQSGSMPTPMAGTRVEEDEDSHAYINNKWTDLLYGSQVPLVYTVDTIITHYDHVYPQESLEEACALNYRDGQAIYSKYFDNVLYIENGGVVNLNGGTEISRFHDYVDYDYGNGAHTPIVIDGGILNINQASIYENQSVETAVINEKLEICKDNVKLLQRCLVDTYNDVPNTGGAIFATNNAQINFNDGLIDKNIGKAGAVILTNGSQLIMNGGSISGNVGTHLAGGVLVENGASFIMNGGTMEDNYTYFKGGAVWATEWGTNGLVEKDWSVRGIQGYPNILNTGIKGAPGEFILNGGKLINNTAIVRGGAINVESDKVKLNKGEISGNVCYSLGGAIYVEGDNPKDYNYTLILGDANDTYITRNTATTNSIVSPSANTSRLAFLNGDWETFVPSYPVGKDYDFMGYYGLGGGYWLCPIGSLGYIFDDTHIIVDENTADGRTYPGNDIFLLPGYGNIYFSSMIDTYNNEKNGEEIIINKKYAGPIAIRNDGSRMPSEVEYDGTNLVIKNNTAVDGGAIASNGIVAFGNPEGDIIRYETQLELTKIWDQLGISRDVEFQLSYYDGVNEIPLDDYSFTITGESSQLNWKTTVPVPNSVVDSNGNVLPTYKIRYNNVVYDVSKQEDCIALINAYHEGDSVYLADMYFVITEVDTGNRYTIDYDRPMTLSLETSSKPLSQGSSVMIYNGLATLSKDITNTLRANNGLKYKVVKVWDDDNSKNRPENITLNLYDNIKGNGVVLTSNDNSADRKEFILYRASWTSQNPWGEGNYNKHGYYIKDTETNTIYYFAKPITGERVYKTIDDYDYTFETGEMTVYFDTLEGLAVDTMTGIEVGKAYLYNNAVNTWVKKGSVWSYTFEIPKDVLSYNIVEMGTYDGVDWAVVQYANGIIQLQIGNMDEVQTMTDRTTRYNTDFPWYKYLGDGSSPKKVNSITFVNKVIGNGSYRGMFRAFNGGALDLSNFDCTNVTEMHNMLANVNAKRIIFNSTFAKAPGFSSLKNNSSAGFPIGNWTRIYDGQYKELTNQTAKDFATIFNSISSTNSEDLAGIWTTNQGGTTPFSVYEEVPQGYTSDAAINNKLNLTVGPNIITNKLNDTTFRIKKIDNNGNLISGVILRIYQRGSRESIERITTDGLTEWYEIPIPASGEYIIRETLAPSEFTLIDDIHFTVTEDRKIIINSEETTDIVIVNNPKLAEEQYPKIEKYINAKVHETLPYFNEPFTYSIMAYVPEDATSIEITDTLQNPLQFSTARYGRIVPSNGVVIFKDNNHIGDGINGTVASPRIIGGNVLRIDGAVANNERQGCPLVITGQTISLTLDDNFINEVRTRDLRNEEDKGFWVMLSYEAEYKPEFYYSNLARLTDAENGWLTNEDLKSLESDKLNYIKEIGSVKWNNSTSRYILKVEDIYYRSNQVSRNGVISESWEMVSDQSYINIIFDELPTASKNVIGSNIDSISLPTNGYIINGEKEHSGTSNQASYQVTNGNNPYPYLAESNKVTVIPPKVTLEVRKIWKNALGESVQWPLDVQEITINVLLNNTLVTDIKLTEAKKSDSIELPKFSTDYILEEVEIPGYITTKEGGVFTNTKEPEPRKLAIKKTDNKGNLIRGVELQIYSSQPGNSPITIVTNGTTEWYELPIPEPGEYIIRETSAPTKFTIIDDVHFTVTEDQKIIVNGEETTDIVIVNNPNLALKIRKDTIDNLEGTFNFTARIYKPENRELILNESGIINSIEAKLSYDTNYTRLGSSYTRFGSIGDNNYNARYYPNSKKIVISTSRTVSNECADIDIRYKLRNSTNYKYTTFKTCSVQYLDLSDQLGEMSSDGEYNFTLTNDDEVLIENIPYGYSYRVYETIPQGWFSETESSYTGVFNRDELTTLSFVNNKYHKLSIKKEASHDKDEEFKFKIRIWKHLGNNSRAYYTNLIESTNNHSVEKLNDGEYTFILKPNQELIIPNIPHGYEYDIYELDKDGNAINTNSRVNNKWTLTSATNNVGTLEDDVNVVFRNELDTYDLTIEKQVTGNMGNKSKSFTFTLSIPSLANETIKDSNNNNIQLNANGQYQFILSHDQSLTIVDLPHGTQYSISESDYSEEGYKTKIDGKVGRVIESSIEQDTTHTVENRNQAAVPTEIKIYWLSGCVPILLAAIWFVYKKKKIKVR